MFSSCTWDSFEFFFLAFVNDLKITPAAKILLITAISALPIMPFKFIAPGAVMVGLSDKNKFGRVALVGPLTNLVMGFLFLISTYIYPYHSYLYAGASFNAWIALFNLLPFGVLDGEKIFNWNKIAWGLTMASTMILFIAAYI
jgi:Zn-dependent protease